MKIKEIKILILSDDRVGHINRSQAVVAAIARHRAVDVRMIQLPIPPLLPKAFLPRLARLLSPTAYLGLLHKTSAADFSHIDLIISTGGATIGANWALAKLLRVKNIYVGKNRGFPPRSFNISLAPYTVTGKPVAGHMLIQPVNIDPDSLISPYPRKFSNVSTDFSIGFLLGAPTREAPFSKSDWDAIATLITRFTSNTSARIVVSTSPRTPNAAYQALELHKIAEKCEFIDFRVHGPGSANAIFECDSIIATLDSNSMINEGMAARRPVIVLTPDTVKPTEDLSELQSHEKAKRLAIVKASAVTPEVIFEVIASLTPLESNHLEVLSSALAGDLDF
jgi:mitochondrial fission protein ELM1